MEIKQASFLKSSAAVGQCPKPNKPEYAFIGRSNVGKSSLINKICQRKSLAKISSTPGKTQLINHFFINKDEWYLVDLPGFGYAKVSKTLRSSFSKIITDYIKNRENLMCLFVLIDSRIPMQKIDLDFMNLMLEEGNPIAIVFTKTDKLNKEEYASNMKAYEEKLLEYWEELPPVFYTSSKNGEGTKEILDFIDRINQSY
ncbi:ribosome biogenesis GTP-binding protein YihA/YsxC [Carboxylicivirga sp. N1Y90]|uniref:ribosome biogenesis GTP-binding protein YihA/YsxC n=1 Tax=Carboxylicivirga fragile TaxID=3417571 RepID=UPI003D32E115|nr:YihA family ribosome biogenesis GTP-binding protein [Marinilabiliaceae bacterium N1Y90]